MLGITNCSREGGACARRRPDCACDRSCAVQADGSDLPPLDSPVYDKDANSAYWSWRPWAVVARGAQIAL